ncbi:hypothetical protein BTVI_47306 [Pitangus sulphuratus]|nr:hypothetical protein BTVI_47306 [Pitangus sulphuratus]
MGGHRPRAASLTLNKDSQFKDMPNKELSGGTKYEKPKTHFLNSHVQSITTNKSKQKIQKSVVDAALAHFSTKTFQLPLQTQPETEPFLTLVDLE